MRLETRNGITTRKDGLPYDVIKTGKFDGITNVYQFRATGNPAKPVVLAETKTEQEAIMLLVLQAPEGEVA
jgi:hypothetical protein